MNPQLANEERIILEKQYNEARIKEKKRRMDTHTKIQNGATIHAIFGRWLSPTEVNAFIRVCKRNISVFEDEFQKEEKAQCVQKPPEP